MTSSNLGIGRVCAGVRRVWPDAPPASWAGWKAIEQHYELLRKWNSKVNLVGPSTLASAAEKHYAESLFLAVRMPEGVRTIIDCGSGAGFPGFPFAVLRPDVQVTLLESDRRKAAFLREACHFNNVRVRVERLEQLTERTDAVITRAVDPRFVMSWGQKHAARFGFIGSSADVESLCAGPAFDDLFKTTLPWQSQSSVLWTTFHVKHP